MQQVFGCLTLIITDSFWLPGSQESVLGNIRDRSASRTRFRAGSLSRTSGGSSLSLWDSSADIRRSGTNWVSGCLCSRDDLLLIGTEW